MNEEIWKPIPGFAGYEVSDMGSVRSFRRKAPALRKLTKDRKGYLLVIIGQRPNRRTARVHTLVMETFVGPRPELLEVAHLDGNPSNNVLGNLAYVTHKENMSHMAVHRRSQFGTANIHSVLSADAVLRIRSLDLTQITLTRIAQLYQVSIATIHHVITGKTWKHLLDRE